ncbi:MAG: ABC transporter ATP-binding protein [bacterium]|nr:ABC transporter ATP-binding protein [bacterium]
MESKSALKWIIRHTKKHTAAIVTIAVATALNAAIYVCLALITKNIVNAIFLEDAAMNDIKNAIFINCIYIVLFILAQTLLTALVNVLKTHVSGKMDMELKSILFDKYINKQYRLIQKIHSGETINRFTSDIEIVINSVIGIVPESISIITKIIAGLAVLIYINKYFALAITAVGILAAIGGRIIGPVYKRLHKKMQQTAGVVRSFLQECIENIIVIKTFSTKLPVHKKLKLFMQENYKMKIKRNNLSVLINAGVLLIFNCGYYAAFACGAVAVAVKIMTYGDLIAIMQIVSQIRAPFYNMSGIIPQFYSALASAERLMELQDLDEDVIDPNFDRDSVYEKLDCITAKNISFGYGKDKIIKNSDVCIKKGSVVSIVGASGTGKSTFFRLLLGLYCVDSGSLTLKCSNGDIDISATTRKLFSYVPQGNLILSGTIRDNIAFANPDVDDEVIVNAAKAADIYDFINSLEYGFETVLGERGIGLSEGQIQRLAIARAIVCNAPILLLDECTSALDEQTERRLLQNIKNLKTKTVIFISHRRAALEICDSIITLENAVFTQSDN